MKSTLISLLAGLIFGLGLVISGMSNPAKVLGFLDITDNWDPSLIFVMLGGIVVTAIGYKFIFKSYTLPIFADKFTLPTNNEITPKLILGSSIFGVGWALAGLCPGPAFTTLTTVPEKGIFFIIAMFIGILVHDKIVAPQLS